MAIEWIELEESQLLQLVLYKTITHERSDDVLHLSEFDALDNANIDVCVVTDNTDTSEYRVYFYTHKSFENATIIVEHDASCVPLPPHTAWWCIEDDHFWDNEYDDRSFAHLVATDTIRLDEELINLVDFRLATDQYGERIYVYDTQEVRYFFYRSTWEDALEDY